MKEFLIIREGTYFPRRIEWKRYTIFLFSFHEKGWSQTKNNIPLWVSNYWRCMKPAVYCWMLKGLGGKVYFPVFFYSIFLWFKSFHAIGLELRINIVKLLAFLRWLIEWIGQFVFRGKLVGFSTEMWFDWKA